VRAYDRAAYYGSAAWKALGVDGPAEAMRHAQGPTVWAYRFDWDELPSWLWWDLSTLLGAAHALEIPFVFGRFELGRLGGVLFDDASEAGRVELSTAMMSYWAQLAHAGDPGQGRDGSLPAWGPWGRDGETFLVLDTADGGGIRMADERVSVPGLVEEALGDDRIADDAARCEILRGLAWRAEELAMETVDAMPPCAGVPAADG
jgi:para-nitrobenzyl esterase